ncbi:hypothetical protein MMC30_004342 [Trapelia coarctata]|nr:hypothetical protein [Trapelia coarctata]
MLFSMPAMGVRPVLSAFGVLLLVVVARFFVKLYTMRMRMVKLRKMGMPMPPHSFLFGHLIVFGKLGIPNDVHGHVYCRMLRRAYPDLPPNFYVDIWPFGEQMLMISDPTVAYQVAQESSLPKFEYLKNYMTPLTGDKDLLTMEGKEWKTWRGIYNPGFAAAHLMTMVPGIVEDTQVFCDVMTKYAKAGGLFKLEEIFTRLTVDIIGRVILDTRMNAQTSSNDLLDGFRSQVQWLPLGNEINPFRKYRPLRPLVFWYNLRRMNNWLSRELDARFSSRQATHFPPTLKRSKPVIDLALDAYLASRGESPATTGMDSTFKSFAITQIKLFLFAGHDTTSSTLCYVNYLLASHPAALATLTEELDTVFGTDLSETAELIAQNPHLLNKLPYTTAVFRETLRLFPPASTLRQGSPSFSLSIPNHPTPFPTFPFTVWIVSEAMHRCPLLWPRPDEFLPERWIVPEGHELYPVKGAWRPFEFGPRNCIGQEVAVLESKIIIACTVRMFEVLPAYREWDQLRGREGGRVAGERAYQVLLGSAKPSDGMPARVRLRGKE